MKMDFLMILTLVILQGVPSFGASKVAYRSKKRVYVAFTMRDLKKRGPSSLGDARPSSFLTASLHENARLVQIHDEPIPEESNTKP